MESIVQNRKSSKFLYHCISTSAFLTPHPLPHFFFQALPIQPFQQHGWLFYAWHTCYTALILLFIYCFPPVFPLGSISLHPLQNSIIYSPSFLCLWEHLRCRSGNTSGWGLRDATGGNREGQEYCHGLCPCAVPFLLQPHIAAVCREQPLYPWAAERAWCSHRLNTGVCREGHRPSLTS